MPATREMRRIGIISDTHGFLPPGVPAAFAGAELILHAGDVGGAGVLEELERIAPVLAVRGNTDRASELPAFRRLALAGKTVLLVHDLARLEPASRGTASIVVHGHTHRAAVETRPETLLINPGSASRPRDGAGSVALLDPETGWCEIVRL